MVTASTRPQRELFGAALIAVAGVLTLVTSVSLLFSENGDVSDRALVLGDGLIGPGIVNPLLVLMTVAGVLVVTHLGEPTAHARPLTLAGIAVLGVLALVGVVLWIAGLTGDTDIAQPFGGLFAFVLLGLALLGLVTMALLFVVTVFRALPAPVRAPRHEKRAWSSPGPAPQEESRGWGQPSAQQPAQPTGQTAWGTAPPPVTPPPAEPPSWGQQPGQQEWAPPEQQWGPPAQTEPTGWEQPETQPADPQTADPQTADPQPADPQTAQWGAPPEPSTEQVPDPAAEQHQPVEPVEPVEEEEEEEPQPGWWRPSAQ